MPTVFPRFGLNSYPPEDSPKVSSGSTAQMDAYYAREGQHLPFLRQKLSDAERAQLCDALEQASFLEERNEKHRTVLRGATVVAASLETSRRAADFTSGRIGLLIKETDDRILNEALLPLEGLYAPPGQLAEWRFQVAPAKTDEGSIYQPGWFHLPATELVRTLAFKAQVVPSGVDTISSGEETHYPDLLASFRHWCFAHYGLDLSASFLRRVETDLTYRITNAENGDAAMANIINGHLSREMGATGHYSSIATDRVRTHYVKALSSQVTPSRFVLPAQVQSISAGSSISGATCTSADSGVIGVRVKASFETLEEIRETLDASIAELTGRGRPRPDRQQLLHNYLTLRVWLMTSIAVGARFAKYPLINPDALLPGDLFMIADKQSDRNSGESADPRSGDDQDLPGHLWWKAPPATRVIALPEHVAEQIREYGRYYKGLLGPACPEQSRWAPFFYLPNNQSSKPRNVRLLWADQVRKYLKYRSFGGPTPGEGGEPTWLKLLGEISGAMPGEEEIPRMFNRWRHLLRQQLIGTMPGEVIDAHLGHAQTGQDPWVFGAALDPVETWVRMRCSISRILPPRR